MALLKGRFIDPSEAIKLSSDPASGEDVARKVYVDTKSSADAAAAQAAAQSYTDQKIADLINASPATLDTLQELANALGQDPNFATTVASQLGVLNEKIDEEAVARSSAIAAEAAQRQAADSAEQSARETADQQEASARSAADTVLDGKITAEQTARQAADAVLDGKKVSKAGDTMTGELILQDGLTTLNPISGFDSGGEHTLTISPEYAEFILRKQNFQTSITPNYALFTEIDTEGSGSWKGITFIEKSSIYLYDENNNPSLPVEPAQVTTKAYVDGLIESNTSSLQSVDSGLQSQITQEVSDRQVGDAASQAYTDSKIGNLEGAPDVVTYVSSVAGNLGGQLAGEMAIREAADTALDARLNVLEAAPQVQGQKFGVNLSAQDVANGYVDMPFEPMPMTMMVVVSGIVHSEEEDYTLSTSNGVTRISFIGDLAAKLQEGDKLRVQFLKHSTSGNNGGGGGGGGGGGSSYTGQITSLTSQELPGTGLDMYAVMSTDDPSALARLVKEEPFNSGVYITWGMGDYPFTSNENTSIGVFSYGEEQQRYKLQIIGSNGSVMAEQEFVIQPGVA